jgi:ABC-type glycerol-3-phosphate transport system substrate-binding protein
VRLAITCFTAPGSETKVVSGPEPFEAAKDKLRAAMRNGHAPGVWEIWASEGISDRFNFEAAPAPTAPVPAPEAMTTKRR